MNNTSLFRTINDIMYFLKIVMIIIFVLYCFSGFSIIKPGEVGVVLRFGKIVGDTLADKIKKPGWVFAFPFPVDILVRLPLKEIQEIAITELAPKTEHSSYDETIDPVKEGYCISGDQNVFQADIIVKYQISNPISVITKFHNSLDSISLIIHDIIVSQMIACSAEFSIDGLLTDNKTQLAVLVEKRSQDKLDIIDSGIQIISVEFKELIPSVQVKSSFEEVNTAAINRIKDINTSQQYRQEMIPRTSAKAREKVDMALSYNEELIGLAEGQANSFLERLSGFEENSDQIKKDMINNTRINIFQKLKDIIVIPSEKECDAEIWTFLKGSEQKLTSYDFIDKYEEMSDE